MEDDFNRTLSESFHEGELKEEVMNNIIGFEAIPISQPHEQTFVYPSNTQFLNETVHFAYEMAPNPTYFNASDHIGVAHWDHSTPPSESVSVHSNPTNVRSPMTPYQNIEQFCFLDDASTPRPSMDMGPSVVQNWAPFDTQWPLPSDNMQHFAGAPPQTSHISSLLDNHIHPSLHQVASTLSTLHGRTDIPNKVIGNIYSQDGSDDYIFKCDDRRCNHKTFTRWYDLRRHHEGTNSNNGPSFWCQVHGCQRSVAEGGRPFPRKDKLNDHISKMHRDVN